MLELNFIGNIGNDAVIKKHNDKEFISFSVAVTEKYKSSSGEKKENTLWINCTRSAGSGEFVKYLKQGTKVYVSGSPSFSTYQDKNGNHVVSVNVYADKIELLSSKQEDPQS